MDRGDLDPSADPPEDSSPARRSYWPKGLACVAIVPLLVFIGDQGRTLWSEWRSLKDAEVQARANEVIGYVGINPIPNMAGRPADWLHDEGNETLLWAGYRGEKHQWFRVGLGEITNQGLSLPFGRDTIRAVDRPIFEGAGGPRWSKIPDEALMAGLVAGDDSTVYPIRVLDKVMVVNDRIADRPILVTFHPVEGVTTVFRGDLDGRVLAMGQSGYFIGHRPLLFDRESESLWLERGEEMAAIAGKLKGKGLPRIARIEPAAWSEWRGRSPRTRLLVGADRAGWDQDGPTAMVP